MSPPTFGVKRALQIFAAFWGVQLLVAVVVGVYAGYRHVVQQAPGGQGAPGGGIDVDGQITLGAAFGGTLLAGLVVWRMVRRSFEGAPAAIGWTRASGPDVARGALQGLALVALFIALGTVLPAPQHALGPLASAARAGGWARATWAVLAFGVAPVVEELVFRGVFYTGLAARWRPDVAGAVTTAVFVALHVTEIRGYWPAWIAIGMLGALALRARVRTGSLLPAIALHATYNFGLVLTVFATPAR